MVPFAAEMLGICRREIGEYSRVIGQFRTLQDNIRRTARAIARELVDPFAPAPAELAALRDLLIVPSAVPMSIAARGIALGIDEAVGAQYLNWFRGRDLHLRPNDPYPVLRSDPHRLRQAVGGARISVNPASLGQRFDETLHLRLAPADLTHEVHFDCTATVFDCVSCLIPLGRPMVIATGTFNEEIAEFDVALNEQDGTFFNVRPLPPHQADSLVSAVSKADALGARILVLPELAVPIGSIARIQSALDSTTGALRLVVAGSYHEEAGNTRRNRSCVLAPGLKAPLFMHDKQNPYVHDGKYTEDLRRDAPPVVRVCVGDGASVAVVICKDLLDQSVFRLLEDLYVRIVLVPSLTAEFGPFRSHVGKLVTSNQCFIALASNPARCGDVTAIFGLPRERQPVVEWSRPHGHALPGVSVLAPGTADVNWTTCITGEA